LAIVIEGGGKAVLYTGDTRSEPWFVNKLARSPNLIEYTSGIKFLDKIYLDTSFTQDIPFQTKAEGLAELLRKVAQYPDDTIFHFQAWTYGYEDVWLALSKALKSPVGFLSHI
jgi:DNA cross-link repair 1C protein